MVKLKPTLVDIKNSKMIYMGNCDGYSEVFQRIAPDLWKRRGGGYRYPVMNDHELQSYLHNEMKWSLYNQKHGERSYKNLVWNERRKNLAYTY